MKFCPKCGSLMVLKRGEDGQPYWYCPTCGYRENHAPQSMQLVVIRQKIEHNEKEKIVVIRDQEIKALSKTRAICPRCGYHEAYFWTVQTRRADEPPTRFFKCVRCGYVWREYD